ncbi:MAG TPA: RIP metalloprotease RseP [Candidatus Paceibacterota bacterium]|jgi:regulator of sigma E protease|nr:RIP metalloprotease RseP [Candidatus Paceibacterota bacterium]
MLTIIVFLIVLAVLIFVHELGHFLFAKLFGIRVDAFKIGFGPKIFAWTPKDKDGKKGETEYGLNLIPFGGYVKIFGENPDVESTIGVDSKRSLAHKSKWQQVLVLSGGVLFNVLFAWVLYIGLFSHGVTATADGFSKYAGYFSNQRIMITDVLKDSPAAQAGLKSGDVITGAQSITDIQNTISTSKGVAIPIHYERSGVSFDTEIIPKQDIVPDKYAIGIAMSDVVDMKLPFFVAVWEGGHYTAVMLKETVTGLYGFFTQIFQGHANFSEISGPVGIAGVVGDAARLGITYLLMITALISINLAIINLIPFPALDGGRIFFVIIESIIRRPIPAKFTNMVNLVGFSLLMLLMVIVTYKDVVKLFK